MYAEYQLKTSFISSYLRFFNSKLGEPQENIIQLGGDKIFTIKNKENYIRFYLKCSSNTSPKKIYSKLANIRDIYNDIHGKDYDPSKRISFELRQKFEKAIEILLKKKSPVERLLEAL